METQSSKNCLPSDECTKKLDHFFANGLYNSCQATDELVKTIEESQDEALAKKALFLYQRHYSNLERPWDHVTFMYGLGLIYMHFNAYKWAVRAFREAIYVQPNFPRSRDVHTRLGLIFKSIGRYKLSEKHFSLAINDTRPNSGTSTKQELEFQLAHLYELQGKFKQAKEAYERLLQQNNLPHQLSANIYRQLGCMFFIEAEAQSRNGANRKQNMFNSTIPNDKIDAALNYLNTSYRADDDPRTSYYLGRCFTNISRYQDAFNSYRTVIDREESTADTWCSIGILYHRQKQPVDAQQAYIRSVQFDKQHVVAWRNLGILYEDHELFDDALKCYQHALRFSSNNIDESLQVRISLLQKQLAEIESCVDRSKTKIGSDKLLSLEDLWNLESNNNKINPKNDESRELNQSPSIQPSAYTSIKQSEGTIDQHCLAVEQRTNGIHALIVNNPSLITSPTKTASSNIFQNCANISNNHGVDSKLRILSSTDPTQISPASDSQVVMLGNIKQERPSSSQGSFESKPGSSKDLSMTQVLTNGASKDSGISSNSSIYADCALVPSQNTNIKATSQVSANQVIEDCRNHPRPKKIDINLLIDEDRPPCIYTRAPPYPPISKNQLILPTPSMFLDNKKDLASKKLQTCCQRSPISLVRNLASVLKMDLELFSTKTITEIDPDQHVEIAAHLLNPSAEGSDDRITRNQWTCEITRSSSTISRYANYQLASLKELVSDDVKKQAQKQTFTKESETDSNESASTNAKNTNQSIIQTNSEVQQNLTLGTKIQPNKRIKREPQARVKLVKSANEIDLSDDRKWRPQIGELNKLPSFIKCVSASNILTHVGTSTPGINTILMSMHVPGCKILGSRTPNNFCSVCINVGPGDYEWSAVSAEYSGSLTKLCNRYGFDIDDCNWWPQVDDLKKYDIPMYRFSQKPGDLVWVNPGTFYWVSASGLCNRIYWNVGPLCAMQYISASESFELNKLLFRKSDVPMIQVTWNIIININIIFDEELFYAITEVLRRSLKYCVLVKELVEESKKTIQMIDKDEEPGPRVAKFCSLCDCEVFNICFMMPSKQLNSSDADGQSVDLHCVECARRSSPNFDGYYIDQEYDLNYLMKLYDNFIETRKRFLARSRAEKGDNL